MFKRLMLLVICFLLFFVFCFVGIVEAGQPIKRGIQVTMNTEYLTSNASSYALEVSSSATTNPVKISSIAVVAARTDRIDVFIVNNSTEIGYVVLGEYNVDTSTKIVAQGFKLEAIDDTSLVEENRLSFPGYTGKLSFAKAGDPSAHERHLDVRIIEIWK